MKTSRQLNPASLDLLNRDDVNIGHGLFFAAMLGDIEMVSQESGVRSQESGVRSQESGVRSQESGVRTRVSPQEDDTAPAASQVDLLSQPRIT